LNRKSIYWLGFGSGLVIGAILIQLMSLGSAEQPLEFSTVEEEAARYGYRLVKENESAWIVEEKVVHSLYIPEDMTNESIADWLVSSGLLDSREEFLDELARRPDLSILPGYYEIAKPIGLDELIEILTSQHAEE